MTVERPLTMRLLSAVPTFLLSSSPPRLTLMAIATMKNVMLPKRIDASTK